MTTTLSSYTFGGRTRARNTNTGRVEAFLPDALGSTISTPTDSATSGRVSRYTPYGQEYYSNNVWQKPRTGWVVELQYWSTPLRRSDHYMRARHYCDLDHQWTAVDPIWPPQTGYGYSNARPTVEHDASGTQSIRSGADWKCYLRDYQKSHWPRWLSCFNRGASGKSCSKFVASPAGRGWSKGSLVRLGTCIAECESGWDPWSIGLPTSEGQAYGIMQIKPGLWGSSCKAWGYGNIASDEDQCDNISCGMAILCWALQGQQGNWCAFR